MVPKLHIDDIPVVEFMDLSFTPIPGENYRRRIRSLLLCLSDVFALVYITAVVDWE